MAFGRAKLRPIRTPKRILTYTYVLFMKCAHTSVGMNHQFQDSPNHESFPKMIRDSWIIYESFWPKQWFIWIMGFHAKNTIFGNDLVFWLNLSLLSLAWWSMETNLMREECVSEVLTLFYHCRKNFSLTKYSLNLLFM